MSQHNRTQYQEGYREGHSVGWNGGRLSALNALKSEIQRLIDVEEELGREMLADHLRSHGVEPVGLEKKVG